MKLAIVGGVGAGMSAVSQARRIDPAAEILALLVSASQLAKALG
jgi:NADPH-dependent 2,4-dienoyl-CoA reductase/sulfur reductase-like enzyme